ncbi:MAG: spore germination protein [Eubacteriales bacterium]
MLIKIKESILENKKEMGRILPLEKSFDLLQRDIIVGGRTSILYFVDGFTKDEALMKIMPALFAATENNMPLTVEEFTELYLPYAEIDFLTDYETVVKNILSGVTCLFIDKYDTCIAIDCRTYPARSVEEPQKDKSLRGSRDGFVETIVFNTALIRRRIRSPKLVMEMKEVGNMSKTDIAICYIEDRVNQEVLNKILYKLDEITVDALPMNQQSLANELYTRKWFNPFPKFKFTERPDTTAACLLEGKVVILVDNSPSAMILPTSILDLVEEANDYYFPTITNVYLKLTRMIITVVTLFLTPFFVLLTQNPQWVPPALEFILIQDTVNVPIVLQLLILESSIDGLKLAAINTPNMLSTPLSIVAGIVLGQFSVLSGWFNAEIMLYMAFVAVANYTQPNFELGYALKFMRLLLLILTGLFGLWGFIIGTVITLVSVMFNRTLTGRSYLNVSKN